jgi:hypothetical protein
MSGELRGTYAKTEDGSWSWSISDDVGLLTGGFAKSAAVAKRELQMTLQQLEAERWAGERWADAQNRVESDG